MSAKTYDNCHTLKLYQPNTKTRNMKDQSRNITFNHQNEPKKHPLIKKTIKTQLSKRKKRILIFTSGKNQKTASKLII